MSIQGIAFAVAGRVDQNHLMAACLCRASHERTAHRRAARTRTLATLLDERRYLPKGVPLLKRVLALPGQAVCRADRTITVDGVAMGEALRPRSGGPAFARQGCRVVAAGEVFLMNRHSEDSLDGRYFGPLPATTIVGRADPLWTREED
jgi:type IV secretory pathway protease TraF